MTSERWQRIDEIFNAALEVNECDRAAFVAAQCDGDSELAREVESLLQAHGRDHLFLDSSLFGDAMKAIGEDKIDNGTPEEIGAYKIDKQIGHGGMGAVYLAHDSKLERKVAVKLLPADLSEDEDRLRRFEREARLAAKLSHPNICVIHEVNQTEDGRHFIVMEYVEGVTLRQLLSEKKMPLADALDIASQVAAALSAAHEAGICHRDIKPENVMIRKDGFVKVLDFGLAKLTEADASAPLLQTSAGLVMGTVCYMSPEQARGLPVDERSDIFSLGVVIYEMLAGRRPFAGETMSDCLAAVLTSEPPPLKLNLPNELGAIVHKTLEKDRDRRYQRADELAAALKSAQRALDRQSPVSSRAKLFRRIAAGTAVLLVGAAVWRFAPKTIAIDSIAVLPFENETHDPEADYLADGFSESITNNLAAVGGVRVIPRNTAFHYRGKDAVAAGRELHVRSVVTGRVLQRGDDLRLSAELIDINANKQVWGAQYNRTLSDALALQLAVSQEISRRVRPELSADEQRRLALRQPEDAEAFRAYLKGRYLVGKRTAESIREGIAFFNQAIDRDPSYALAYAGLSGAYAIAQLNTSVAPDEVMPKARAAAQKALRIDPDLGAAHGALHNVLASYDWDWDKADEEIKRAIAIDPNDAVYHAQRGVFLSSLGRNDEAISEIKTAMKLDPLEMFYSLQLGVCFHHARKYDDAIAQLQKTLQLNPNFWVTHHFLGGAYEQKGMHDKALEELLRARNQSGISIEPLSVAGYVYAVSGRKADALRVIEQLKENSQREHVAGYHIAMVYAGLGDADQAFTHLERSFQERDQILAFGIKCEPRWDHIRSDPRFNDLLRRMHFRP